MKTLLILALSFVCWTAAAEDMHAHMDKTRELVEAKKYAEALERMIWFHNHALEHDRGMTGVRLSFALSDWKELGEVYPPAAEALVKIRDEKAAKFRENPKNAQLFQDVAAINNHLEKETDTLRLFEWLSENHPKTAEKCWVHARQEVFDAKRYDLARKYIGNPVREFASEKESYERNLPLYKDPEIGGAQFKAFNENNFVGGALQLIEISLALGDRASALEIQKQASALVDDHRLRDAIPKEEAK